MEHVSNPITNQPQFHAAGAINAHPAATIIVRACNIGRFLPETLASIALQDFNDWEAIILDDASQDNTADAIAPFIARDQRFKYLKNVKRLGRTRNLNLGLSLARGKFTCVLDGDDFWSKKHTLRTIIACLHEHPDTVLVAGNVAEVNEKSETLRDFPSYWVSDAEVRNHLLIENIIAQNSVCFPTALIRSLGGYDERLRYTEDYELWLRLGRYGKVHKIDETLGCYRIHGSNVGVRKRRRQIIEELWVVWRYRRAYPHLALALMNRVANFTASLFPKSFRHAVARVLGYHERKAKLLVAMSKRAPKLLLRNPEKESAKRHDI